MRCEMNIVAMAKGGERYVFLYDDENQETLLDVFDRFAENSELNFSAKDADLLKRKVLDSSMSIASDEINRDGKL